MVLHSTKKTAFLKFYAIKVHLQITKYLLPSTFHTHRRMMKWRFLPILPSASRVLGAGDLQTASPILSTLHVFLMMNFARRSFTILSITQFSQAWRDKRCYWPTGGHALSINQSVNQSINQSTFVKRHKSRANRRRSSNITVCFTVGCTRLVV